MTADVESSPPPPTQHEEIEFIEDLDVLSESDMCSCGAGDDNPF